MNATMRDTDRDWGHIGEHTPYFGVFTNKALLTPTPADIQQLFATGEVDVAHVIARLQHYFPGFSPEHALDFGCGVGRLVIPIAKRVRHVTGVDVSKGMLDTARKHLAEANVSVTLLQELPSETHFDWINSCIVFQHIPPERGYRLIRQLWQTLNVGGCLSLQLTIFRHNSHVSELLSDLKFYRYDGDGDIRNLTLEEPTDIGMRMHDYDLTRVLLALDADKPRAFHLETTDHGGCHGVWIFCRK